MRPPLVQLGGSENFAAYQAMFDQLYHTSPTVDVLGNVVIFNRDRCEHVCFKSSDRVWNKGQRDNWSQERAERIAWIRLALETPNFIRETPTGSWVYLREIPADRENNLAPELYAAVVDATEHKHSKAKQVYFLTAFRIT